MKVLGSPQVNNQIQINRIKGVLQFKNEIQSFDEEYFARMLRPDMRVLDVGKSLREKTVMVQSRVNSLETLDINVFQDYPDIQMDLCERIEIPQNLRYDVVYCFSLLEHCYNPFNAAENLFSLLKPNSRIVGSVPFLFPHHCPEDLSYQDYFRFTKDSFTALFPKARKIIVTPHRGRVGAGLNIISQHYKDILEKRLGLVTRFVNNIERSRKPQQSSGFDFEIQN
jgi:SAM-dependent methyltransferase